MKQLSVIAFGLVAVAFAGQFADGYFCTRTPWLLVGPIELLYLPAFVILGIATIGSIVTLILAKQRKKPMPVLRWGWQAIAWAMLALLFYGGFDPRLTGLAVRARIHEERLIDFCSKYRAGGEASVATHPVRTWGLRYKLKVRASERFVEISWGATLPRSWGIRISDQARPVPEFVTGNDESARAATSRLTVFIGLR
jgi:hypothetical protein